MASKIKGMDELRAAFRQYRDDVKVKKVTGVALAGNAYKNDVQGIAPYKTGDYRRSIHVEMQEVEGEPVALVGTNKPQGKRLEYGYVGPDKLGRIFNQAPRPHFRPPLDQNYRKYLNIIIEAITE